MLQPGMIVAFEDEEGRLLRVLQEGKVWGMFPLEEAPPAPSPEGAIKVRSENRLKRREYA